MLVLSRAAVLDVALQGSGFSLWDGQLATQSRLPGDEDMYPA